jgi:hypothetical protein
MIDVALKEWAIITDLLLSGEQVMLLRKGGIHEEHGPGRFRLEHERFALFPAWEHQKPDWLKPGFQDRCAVFDAEPAELTLRGLGDVARIWEVPSRDAFDRLDDLHAWGRPQIDMRFSYKPERPLYLVALRALRLARPKTIAMKPSYWGCRSWVPLEPGDAVDDRGAQPVLDDARFAAILERIDAAMTGTDTG